VVIGILRIVEEILQQRKDAKIVINSMFPMTSTRGGFYPLISDFEDSFSRLEGNRREQRRRSLLQSTVTLQSTRNRTVAGVSFGNDPIDRARIYRKLRKQKRSRSIGGDGSSASTELSEDAWSKDMTAEAQEEEERREQLAKTKKVRNRNKRDDRNPTLTDRENIRAYEWNGESTAKPLWTSIRVINKALRDFAAKNKDRVHFFDATDIFTKKVGKSYTLLTDRISIRGHPTELGFRLWEDAMVATLEDILAVMRKEQPKLFVIPTPPSSSSSTFSGLESNGVGGDGNGGKPKDDDEFAGALRAPYDDPFSIFQSSESEQWRLPNDGTDDKNDVDDPNDGGDLVVDNGSVGDNVDATDDGG
jgi:hypothetical protein